MEKEFVPYELAFRMKALGFDDPCMVYFEQGILKRFEPNFLDSQILNSDFSNRLEGYHLNSCSAPTWGSAFKWFRKEYNLKFHIREDVWNNWCSLKMIRHDDYISIGEYKTYEEAELACLEKLIEIIEEKQK
jgi:hypothetical protein